MPKLCFEKTSLLMRPALENGSILNKQVKRRHLETRLMPGVLNLQLLLGPRRCRYFQPVGESIITVIDVQC